MVSYIKKNKLKILTFILLTLLFKPLWLFNNSSLGIPGDDMSYWLHAATLAYDQDIEYTNDYIIESAVFNPTTNAPSHPPGAGYLASPFVYLFSQLDKLFDFSSNSTRTNPTKTFAYLGFFISGLFYTFFGLTLISKIIKKYNNKNSGLFIFCGLISTLIHYVSTRFLMSHSVEFFLCCSLIYFYEKDMKNKLNSKEITKLLITYFLLAITRPSTFLYSLILLLFYRSKFSYNFKILFSSIIKILGLTTLYIFLSRKLYQNNFMLMNTYGSEIEEYSASINFEQIISGLLNLPKLFFSTNMGIIYSTPIIFLATIIFFTKFLRSNKRTIDKFILFFYFGASVTPLLIWQGREVAYGQRLLIGLIPISILLTSKYLFNIRFVLFAKILTIYTYIGYLFFYSSEKLTLNPGISLWGTKVGFTAENYYIEVLKAFLNYETLLSAILRNIYFVDIFKIINLRDLLSNIMFFNNLNTQKVEKFIFFSDVYHNLDLSYLILVNFAIFIFSYFLTKLIFNINK
jgi:hypothetical protein